MAASMRPWRSWVRASAEPSVPTMRISGRPFATHSASEKALISVGSEVRREAPTALPQSDSRVGNSAARECWVKNCVPDRM